MGLECHLIKESDHTRLDMVSVDRKVLIAAETIGSGKRNFKNFTPPYLEPF
jgi:hypothetical protein